MAQTHVTKVTMTTFPQKLSFNKTLKTLKNSNPLRTLKNLQTLIPRKPQKLSKILSKLFVWWVVTWVCAVILYDCRLIKYLMNCKKNIKSVTALKKKLWMPAYFLRHTYLIFTFIRFIEAIIFYLPITNFLICIS